MGFVACHPTNEGMSCTKYEADFLGVPAMFARVDLENPDKAPGIGAYSFKSIVMKVETQVINKACQEKIKRLDPKNPWNDLIDDSCITSKPIEQAKDALQSAGWLKDPSFARRASSWIHPSTPAVITIKNDGGITIQWDTNGPERYKEVTAFVATETQRDTAKDTDIEMMRK
jgi:hypothetical protein